MVNEVSKNIRLGIFVATGTVLFIFSLYLIGLRKNIFGNTVTISARFKNVNGLMEGNNVRFGGIDVGSIDQVVIASDSDILVVMLIESKARKHIRKNYFASIGTDGLMGNRLVNIVANPGISEIIKDGDILPSINPMETEEMLRAFNATGKNMKTITDNLNAITSKLNENNSVWELLGSKAIAGNIDTAILDFKKTSRHAEEFTQHLNIISKKLSDKESLLNVFTNPIFREKTENIILNLEQSSKHVTVMSEKINDITEKINHGKGSASMILNDSSLANNLSESMENLKKSAEKLDENLEALQHSIFLKNYFKRIRRNKK